jgi:hypothetical protein
MDLGNVYFFYHSSLFHNKRYIIDHEPFLGGGGFLSS